MKKLTLVIMVVLLLNLSLANAHITQQEINEAKSLINSKVSCKSLSESQLQIMGEYYMEQMHPGESHELMHQMMGLKEGSEDEEQFHINMAKAIYCGEENVFGPGGMMGGGMMNMMMNQNPMQTNLAQGMMGNRGYGLGYWNFINIPYMILLIGLIILVYLWILKLWENMKNKGGKK